MAKNKMISKKLAEDFLFKVDMEGLEYAVTNYMPSKTGDEKFKQLASNLCAALEEMNEYIDEIRLAYDIQEC